MLNLYRRHLQTCPHRAKARSYTKCSYPIWVDGLLAGKAVAARWGKKPKKGE